LHVTTVVRALLISNSTQFGRGYLDHCADAIVLALGPAIRRVLFVPYALFDRDRYTAAVRTRFEQLGFELDSAHDAPGGPLAAVERAHAIFIGGGNTFRLIDTLCASG
jgi:dipeptidase E